MSAKLFIIIGNRVHDCEMLNEEEDDLASKERQDIFEISIMNLEDLNNAEIHKAMVGVCSKNYDAVLINDADFSLIVDFAKNMLVH